MKKTTEKKPTRQVWSTKYALTKGVELLTVEDDSRTDSCVWYRQMYSSYYLTLGKDAFPEQRDALKAARMMARKRIASLKKQIGKLEAFAEHPKMAKADR